MWRQWVQYNAWFSEAVGGIDPVATALIHEKNLITKWNRQLTVYASGTDICFDGKSIKTWVAINANPTNERISNRVIQIYGWISTSRQNMAPARAKFCQIVEIQPDLDS